VPKDRTGYAPWSLTREAGVQSATVDGTITVPQYLQPVIDTGFVDEKGNWKGTKSSDETFFISDTAEGIANGGEILFPNTANASFIDMTGFTSLFIAIKPTNGGNFLIQAVMGPDSEPFANLTPVNPASLLRGSLPSRLGDNGLDTMFSDSAESCTADVWNIFSIQQRLQNQKNMQFKLVNNTGGSSDVDFAYIRMV
jgi:hypothetical protein